MLKRLHLKNFTVFADADFEFGPGLNVLVGTNGTGKSHVLKVGYAVIKTVARFEPLPDFELVWDWNNIRNFIRDEINYVFLPQLNDTRQLIRWQSDGNNTTVEAVFNEDSSLNFKCGISNKKHPDPPY